MRKILLISLLVISPPVLSQSIVMIGKGQEFREGFIQGLGDGETKPSSDPDLPIGAKEPILKYDANKTVYQYKDIEFIFEDDPKKFTEISNSKDNIGIVCRSSGDCSGVFEPETAKDLLVVSTTASSSNFSTAKNMLRLAPSNKLQTELLLSMISDGIPADKKYAVIYEVNEYGVDLYKNFISQYLSERVISKNSMPAIGISLPLHSYLDLTEEQKGINTDKVISLIKDQSVEGIVYIGLLEGFNALTDVTKGGDRTLAKKWYSVDGINDYKLKESNFKGLEFISLFYSATNDTSGQNFYYGFDAGKFLQKILQDNQKPSRKTLLAKAKITVLDFDVTKTGAKSFTSADSSGLFFTHSLSDKGEKLINTYQVKGN
jgi:hypothetical protein